MLPPCCEWHELRVAVPARSRLHSVLATCGSQEGIYNN